MAFAEASEEFLNNLQDAEGDAYGAQFADYSTSVQASGGQSRSATMLGKARKDVERGAGCAELLEAASTLGSMHLGLLTGTTFRPSSSTSYPQPDRHLPDVGPTEGHMPDVTQISIERAWQRPPWPHPMITAFLAFSKQIVQASVGSSRLSQSESSVTTSLTLTPFSTSSSASSRGHRMELIVRVTKPGSKRGTPSVSNWLSLRRLMLLVWSSLSSGCGNPLVFFRRRAARPRRNYLVIPARAWSSREADAY